MLCAVHCHHNCQENNDISQPFLSYNEPDLCNDYISKKPNKNGYFCINFPWHCLLGHVLLDTDLLDSVDSWKEAVQPIKNPRSVDPHKSKPVQPTKKTRSNKKNVPEEQEI